MINTTISDLHVLRIASPIAKKERSHAKNRSAKKGRATKNLRDFWSRFLLQKSWNF